MQFEPDCYDTIICMVTITVMVTTAVMNADTAMALKLCCCSGVHMNLATCKVVSWHDSRNAVFQHVWTMSGAQAQYTHVYLLFYARRSAMHIVAAVHKVHTPS